MINLHITYPFECVLLFLYEVLSIKKDGLHTVMDSAERSVLSFVGDGEWIKNENLTQQDYPRCEILLPSLNIPILA